MFVSFVIPMYNCEAYVQSCVERILHCGLPRQEFEIRTLEQKFGVAFVDIYLDLKQ